MRCSPAWSSSCWPASCSRLSCITSYRDSTGGKTGKAPARALREIQVLENLRRRPRFIERVEMQARRACAQQLLALAGRVLDPILQHRFVVFSALVELAQQGGRQLSTA